MLGEQALSGLWPGRDMKPHELYEAVEKLQSVLCCDTCGGVDAVRYARDAYNQRHLSCATCLIG